MSAGHAMIAGTTMCGKTTLAKRFLVPLYKEQGIGVIVFDPLNDPEWNADFQTSNVDEFLGAVWGSRGCACFIDEAGDSAGRFDNEMHSTATKGRHWGHRMHYLCQRPAQVAPVIRNQCETLYAFTLAKPDAKALAEDFVKEEVLECSKLPKGHYLYCPRFGAVERRRVF